MTTPVPPHAFLPGKTMAFLAFALAPLASISAASISWDGGAGTALWSTANNWTGNTTPGSADDVTIDSNASMGGTNGDQVRIESNTTIGSLTISTASVSIAGNGASARNLGIGAEGALASVTLTSAYNPASSLFTATGASRTLQVRTSGTLAFTNNSTSTAVFANANLGNTTGSTGSDAISFSGAGSWRFATNANADNGTGQVIANNSTSGATLALNLASTFSGTVFYESAFAISTTSLAIEGGEFAVTNGAQITTVAGLVVSAGGALTGNATVQGSASIAGRLEIGSATTRVMTFNSGLAFASTADVNLTINGTAAGSFDSLALTGGLLTYDGDLALTINGSYLEGDSWSLYTGFASAVTGLDSLSINGVGLTASSGVWTGEALGQSWEFDESTGMLSVVPEPSATALALGGFLAWSILFRRRATNSGDVRP